MEFKLNENPDETAINEIRHKLQDYNDPYWEVEDRYKYVLTLKDETALVGGIVFTIFGEWLELDFFWIDASRRHQGYGKELLKKTESFAVSKGCRMSFLNTFSFQARPFYEKNGYTVVYTQKNYPIRNTRYFMEKSLKKA
ncbi:MAG: GNAT family N-acetyltransferase [Spirochaetia bacterium]|jgi:GNAT superfamily N-acetyltransferase|nr:GNAT family N-acetyltransferase [Spirochaetia bacterium]